LRAAATVAAVRLRELEDARRAIQVRRQAEELEGVVIVAECSNCGAPPPPRGASCRYCGTIAPG
jgi:ribosomal protein L40E